MQTIAGSRTFDLVYVRVGKQTITAGETGNFSVTAIPAPGGGSWEASLRLDLDSGIQVRFPSSQEYDLRLRDTAGNILWTWSADKLFLQAEHSSNLGKWNATVTVPNPPAIPEGAQSYTLEAWITTAPGEPQFAAATTLVLARPSARAAMTDRIRRR